MKKIFDTFILSVVFLLFVQSAVYAQSLKFELANPEAQISSGDSFQVNIMINSAGIDIISSDALIKFDAVRLSVDSAQSGNFFTYFSANPLGGTNNKFLASSWEESVAHAKSSNKDTLLAVLNLEAKSGGAATLAFDCVDGTEADSNINRASDSQDIIKCSEVKSLTLNIGGAGPTSTPSPTLVPSSTPTPTLTPTPTSTKTPTPVPTKTVIPTKRELKRAGVIDFPLKTIGIGILLTLTGVLVIL